MRRALFQLTLGMVLTALWCAGAKAADVDRQLQQLGAENNLLKATLQQRNKEIVTLKEEINALKAEVERHKAEPEALRDEIKTLKQSLAEANARLRALVPEEPKAPEPATRPKAKEARAVDKWGGFRGVKWGTSLADAPSMVLAEDGKDTKYYRREGDKLAIGEAELSSIVYGFYKGRFHAVLIHAKGFLNWRALQAAVFSTYGEGKQPNEFIKRWMWGSPFSGVKDVMMSLSYSEIQDKITLTMFYMPIQAEKDADKAKGAKEAKKDF